MDAGQIGKQYCPEIALIVILLRIKLGIASREDFIRFRDENAIGKDFVFTLIKSHELGSVVFSLKDIRDLLPDKGTGRMDTNSFELRARNNLLILAELIRINEKFRVLEIPVIFYKGVLLSYLLFDDFTTRATSDLDILIKSTDFLKIRSALLADGYEEVYFYPENYPAYYLAHTRESSYRKKFQGGHYLYIELQWAPLPEYFGLPYNNDYFFDHMQDIKVAGTKISTLNITQHMLLMMIHHGISDIWRNLKHVFDLAVLISRHNDSIDWQEVYNKGIEWHKEVNFSCGLNLVCLVFGVSPLKPSPWKTNAQTNQLVMESLLSFPLIGKSKKNGENIKRQLLLCDNRKERISLEKGYLKIALWPSLIDLENIKLPAKLFPLYFITKRLRFLFPGKKISAGI